MKVSSRALLVITVVAVASGTATPQTPEGRANAPAVGAVIPSFDAQDLQGKTQHVSFAKGSATVLLFFLSGCPTCHKMIPEWNSAFERKPPRLRVIGVLMDQEPPGFFESVKISFPVVRSPGRQTLQAWEINRAPLTLRVTGAGKIEDVGLGLLDPIRLGEIFRP